MFGSKKSKKAAQSKGGTQGNKDDNCPGREAILAAIKKSYPDQKNHVQTNTSIKSW